MKSNKEKILERISQFEDDVEKATSNYSIREQHSRLITVYWRILKYVDTELKNSGKNSGAKELVVDALKYVEQEYMEYKLIKDPDEKQFRSDRIRVQNIKWKLTTELKMLNEYVTREMVC